MTRIPRKQIAMKFIAMKFKDGFPISTLAVGYQDYFPRMKQAAREDIIIEIIRQFMKKQKP